MVRRRGRTAVETSVRRARLAGGGQCGKGSRPCDRAAATRALAARLWAERGGRRCGQTFRTCVAIIPYYYTILLLYYNTILRLHY